MFSFQNKRVSYFKNIKIFRTTKRKKTIMLRIKNGEIEILCPFFTSDLHLTKIINKKKNGFKIKLGIQRILFLILSH